MSRRKQKPDHRAATHGGGFTGLPHVVQDSEAFRDLSLWARAVLLELIRSFNGYNNGQIAVSQRQIAKALHTSNYRKIGAAIAELMMHGFIDISIEGTWKERRAREYRLTFVSTTNDGRHVPATDEYRRWATQDSGAEAASAEETFAAEGESARDIKPADDASARIAFYRRKLANDKNIAC